MTRPNQHKGPLGEEGATATTFLLVLFVLLGATMLAIDAGNLFVSRRGQIADTDSAALAVAQRLLDCPADREAAADEEAEEYATTKNDTSTVVTAVDFTITGTSPGGCPLSGVVNVTTERQAALFFAPALGFDGTLPTDVGSWAIFGEVKEARGLRPMGICVEEPHYDLEWEEFLKNERGIPNSWIDWPTNKGLTEAQYLLDRPGLFFELKPDGTKKLDADGNPIELVTPFDVHPTVNQDGASYGGAHVHRLPFTVEGSRDDLDFCGDGPSGNFDWLDFDGTPADGAEIPHDCGVIPGNPELGCDVAVGFQGLISLDPPDCDMSADQDDDATAEDENVICTNRGGEVSAADKGLEKVVCPSAGAPISECTTLFIIVYAQFEDDAEFRLEGAVSIVLRDYNTASNVPGDPKNPNHNYLDIEFVDVLLPAKIGPADSTSLGPLGVSLCGSDASFDDRNCDYGP